MRRSFGSRWPVLSRFAKNSDGATVLEFAMIALPFFLMLMGTLEVTMSYFSGIQLENGIETIARQIRTGEIQAQNLTAAQFKNLICAQVAPLIPCDGNLYVDVRTFNDFSNVAFPSPLDQNGQVSMAFQFDPGVSGSIVLARVFYVWHITTPLLSTFISNMSGQDRLLAASIVFRNEPWQAGGG